MNNQAKHSVSGLSRNQSTTDPTGAGLFARASAQVIAQESLILDAINEVLEKMTSLKAIEIRKEMSRNLAFSVVLNRAVLNVALIVSLAKTIEVEDDFDDSMGILCSVEFSLKNGLVGAFAKAMVRCDMDAAEKKSPDDFYLHDSIPQLVLIGRLDQVVRFIESRTINLGLAQ